MHQQMLDKMCEAKGNIVTHAGVKINAQNVFKKQKLKRKKAKRAGYEFDDTKLNKAKYVMQDSCVKEKLYTKEYERLKAELAHKSPEPSPCSSLENSLEYDEDVEPCEKLFGDKEDDDNNSESDSECSVC